MSECEFSNSGEGCYARSPVGNLGDNFVNSDEGLNKLDCFTDVRNDKSCHAELDSASHSVILSGAKNLKSATPHPTLSRICMFAYRSLTNSTLSQRERVKHVAFTLAEVLITLGIIGVVAALTIPSLIADYQEKRTVATLKKAYSTISQAYLLAKNDYGDITEWNLSEPYEAADIFAKYIKNVKKCETQCSFPRTLDLGGNFIWGHGIKYSLIINDGTYIGFGWKYIHKKETDYDAKYHLNSGDMITNYTILVKTDANIPRIGVNYFHFFIQKNKIVPYGTVGWSRRGLCDPTLDTSNVPDEGWNNGLSCAGHVITYGNMDYMKCLRGNQKYCKAY